MRLSAWSPEPAHDCNWVVAEWRLSDENARMPAGSLTTYNGSCHCGLAQFEFDAMIDYARRRRGIALCVRDQAHRPSLRSDPAEEALDSFCLEAANTSLLLVPGDVLHVFTYPQSRFVPNLPLNLMRSCWL